MQNLFTNVYGINFLGFLARAGQDLYSLNLQFFLTKYNEWPKCGPSPSKMTFLVYNGYINKKNVNKSYVSVLA